MHLSLHEQFQLLFLELKTSQLYHSALTSIAEVFRKKLGNNEWKSAVPYI